jgi:3-hydroxy-D-aspartate aldolase
MRHRAHGKMHKSVDVLKLQMEQGGASASAARRSRGRGLRPRRHQDISSPTKCATRQDRPAREDAEARRPRHRLRRRRSRTSPTSRRRRRSGTTLDVFVEIDCGAGCCGVTTTEAVVEIAKAVAAARLRFLGIQAYQGAMQHLDKYEDRKAKLDAAVAQVKAAADALTAIGLEPELVSGGGTGSYYFESNSGVYNELQCGSYAFMDADYGRIHDKDGNRIGRASGRRAVHLTSVMS